MIPIAQHWFSLFDLFSEKKNCFQKIDITNLSPSSQGGHRLFRVSGHLENLAPGSVSLKQNNFSGG
jgi:hypothetical protein